MINQVRLFVMLSVLAAGVVLLTACRTTGSAAKTGSEDLVVGVCPNYPPVLFLQNDRILGVEVEFAVELGKALGRKVRFVSYRWENLIDALMQGDVDIIMSGMTITPARRVRVNFTDPYLKVGIMPLVRTRDAAKFNSLESILGGDARIGVEKSSTGDVFANRNCRSSSITYLQPVDAHYYLVNRRIDVYLHDGPCVVWLAAEHEADLQVIPRQLTDDELAWAVRREDRALLDSVNGVLAQWKRDGKLQRIIDKWMPELKQLR